MCKGSISAEFAEPARLGEQYPIGRGSHGHAVLHRSGENPERRVVCVQDSTDLVLIGIPPALQMRHRLKSATQQVRFLGAPDDEYDHVVYPSGSCALLAEFADHGVQAFVGTMDEYLDERREPPRHIGMLPEPDQHLIASQDYLLDAVVRAELLFNDF